MTRAAVTVQLDLDSRGSGLATISGADRHLVCWVAGALRQRLGDEGRDPDYRASYASPTGDGWRAAVAYYPARVPT